MNNLEKFTFLLLKHILGPKVTVKAQVRVENIVVDFFVPELKLVIMVDGQFWHNSQKKEPMIRLGLRRLAEGKTDKAIMWLDKADQNKKRDKANNQKLKEAGYRLCRLKEERLIKETGAEGYVSRQLYYSLHELVFSARKKI